MKLTAKLAYSQLKINRNRTVWTLLGIAFSGAMITAICGFLASGNEMLKTVLGEDYQNRGDVMATFVGLAVVLGLVIAAVSIVVISNAFRISAGERTSQFGILKSVGATKKQIAASVMYEALWLSIIGIPLGILLGLAVHFAGIEIADYYLVSLNKLQGDGNIQINLEFVFNWLAILIAAAFSLLTVILSAWLPARKAAKISAINAIRGTGEIKLKSKKFRTNPLVQKLFGFEGVLATKSLKRSRRNFRATVISLTISVVLVIVANAVGTFGLNITNQFYGSLDASVVADYFSSITYTNNADGEIETRKINPLEYETAEQITEKLREYPDTTIMGVGTDFVTYNTWLPKEMCTEKFIEYNSQIYTENGKYLLGVVIFSLDKQNYELLCNKAKVAYGSNILVNRAKFSESGFRAEFEPFIFDNQTLTITDEINFAEFATVSELPLHGVIGIEDVPDEFMNSVQSNGIAVIVPEYDCMSFEWFVSVADDEGFVSYAQSVIDEMIPKSELYSTSVSSIVAINKAMNDFKNLILTFIYGFVGMLILIGLTNVISTISTNVRSRSHEFAVLRSTGMTDSGLLKMLNLESILSSTRALIFGLPLGCGLSYLMYLSMTQMADTTYTFPWLPVIMCIIGVFIITWVTMIYSASRLRGKSIIETIRKSD